MLHLIDDDSAGHAVIFRGERAESAAQAFAAFLRGEEAR